MTDVVPSNVKLAAKRGFIRTTYQAYAATLGTGLPSAAAILALVQDPSGWLLAGITVGLAVVTPPLAGVASFLSITAKGLPVDYEAAAVEQSGAVPMTRAEYRQSLQDGGS